jgi:hypothetical protein
MCGMSPEYLHGLLYHHHDTVDVVYKKGKFVFEKKHIHCSFLKFEYAPYIAAEKQFFSFAEVAVHNDYFPSFYAEYHFSTFKVISLRGPPPAC